MSRIDHPDYIRFVRKERNLRVKRNSSKPIIIPSSGIIPNFPPELNKKSTPQGIDGITRFHQNDRKRNVGAKPQGSQRFPRAVPAMGGYVKVGANVHPKGNSIRQGYIEHSRVR